MAPAIEYEKVMTEIVYVNLPGPEEPTPGMSGPQLMHGFLADIHEKGNQEVRTFIESLCGKWNVHYRRQGR